MILARTTIDLPTMEQGRRWHLRSGFRWGFLFPVLGLALSGLFLWLVATGYREKAFLTLIGGTGLWYLIRPFVMGGIFRSALRKMPMFGKEVKWSFEPHFLRVNVKENHSRSALAHFYRITATPEGILMHPQKSLFYWVPRLAFGCDADYERAVSLCSSSPIFHRIH